MKTSKQKEQVQALQQQGMLQARNGDAAGAIPYFEKAAKLRPADPQILNNLGYICQQAGRLPEALAHYQRSLRMAPQDTTTLCNLGLLQGNLGQPQQALETFSAALELKPDDTAILCNRANVLLELEHPERALQDFDRAAELTPDDPAVLNGRANVLSEMLRHQDALVCLDKAIALREDYGVAWSNRGDVYRDLDQIGPALENYERALALLPGDTKTLANVAGIYVTRPDDAAQANSHSRQSLESLLAGEYQADGASVSRMSASGVSVFRLKHDLGQAQYLQTQGHDVAGLDTFIATAKILLGKKAARDASKNGKPNHVPASRSELAALSTFWQQAYVYEPPAIEHCLNPENDWPALEQAYLDGNPEILTIDNFLSASALAAFQSYCLASRVWVREYPNQYLGAFANQGFCSTLHLQLASELQQKMPRVFRDYPLNQLWAFKYDTTLGKGINIHADFALVNLNFWITPDEHNLDTDCGGLKVYETPAPSDWTFHDYNTNSQAMYDYLEEHNSGCQTITYRCNRAVLFNSALFHETDRIAFADGYESRRINITYLFGKQLW